MSPFSDTWISKKKVRAHYEGGGFNFEVMNERTSKNGKQMADFVVCEGQQECFRHTMLTIKGKYSPYSVVTLERERFVPGGDNIREHLEL
jgi:hypothetical protein